MTIVPILWYRPNKDKEYFVKIRLTDKKKVKYVNLNISIQKRFWYKDKITNQHPDSKRLNELITQTIQELRSRHENNILTPPTNQPLKSEAQIRKSSKLTFPTNTLGSILQTFIDEFSSNGKIGSSKKHKVILNHLVRAKLDMVGLEEFDSTHINKFRNHLIEQGVQPQGRHTYEKVVRNVSRQHKLD